MQKLEVYCLDNRLGDFSFLVTHGVEVAAYHKLKRTIRYDSALGKARDVFRFEVFLEEVSDTLLNQINSIGSVIETTLSTCNQVVFDHFTSDTEELTFDKLSKNTPLSTTDTMAGGQASVIGECRIEVKDLPLGRLRLTIETEAKQYFLFKTFGVLAQNDVQLIKANTYLNKDTIVGSFVIGRVNKELLVHLKEKLKEVLTNTEVGNGGYTSFNRPPVSEVDFVLAFNQTGTLPAIKMSAKDKEPLLRYMLQEAFVLFEIEVTVTRIGKLGKMIEDQYYVKSAANKNIDEDLVLKIEKYLLER